MTDLRDVKCLMAAERASLRRIYREYASVIEALDTLDVAVAALRSCFQQYWCMDEDHRAMTKQAFCDMHNLTIQQATDLGIFDEVKP